MSTPSKRGQKKWPMWRAQPSTRLTNGLRVAQIWYIEPSQLDAMAERMARAIKMSAEIHVGSGADHLEEARAALKSIGLVAKKGKL